MNRQIGDLARHDVTARCENPKIDGYPFDIGVRCDHIAWRRPSSGISLEAGKLTSAVAIYAPQSVSGTIDGPAKVELPGSPPLGIAWKALTAGVELAEPAPKMLSLKGHGIRLEDAANAPGSNPLATVSDVETVIRRVGAALRVKVSFADLHTKAPLATGGRLPDLAGSADITLSRGLALLDPTLGPPQKRLRGQSGMIDECDALASRRGYRDQRPVRDFQGWAGRRAP